MSDYQRLTQGHIHRLQLRRHVRNDEDLRHAHGFAEKVHGAVFAHVAEQGLNVFQLNREEIKAWATERAIEYKSGLGILGLFIGQALIAWVVSRVVDWIMNWIINRMKQWIADNENDQVVGVARCLDDLAPMLTEARAAA